MAESEKEEVVKDERPIFRVTQAPGFATGLKLYTPGEEIVWEVPEGWDDKKYGAHFASHGPSTTFAPVNPPAERLLEEHKKEIQRRAAPRPTAADERAAKLEELVLKMINSQGEAQAEARRVQARHEELLEMLIENSTGGGKKKST